MTSNTLTKSILLKKNILWNILGRVIPLAISVFLIPVLIKGMGTERFGILTIIWIVIGYANLFDFGLGSALTQLVSKKLAENNTSVIPSVCITASSIMLFLGIVSAIGLFFLAPMLTQTFLKVSAPYLAETNTAFRLMALSLPILFLTSAVSAILSSYQAFKTKTLVNSIMIIFNLIIPVILLHYNNTLSTMTALLLIGRLFTLILSIYYCKQVTPEVFQSFVFDKNLLKPLFSFGGWLTVSNIINPLMVSFDRFLIANILTAGVISYYTTPFEMLYRLQFISESLSSVMFPALSAELVQNRTRAKQLFIKSSLVVCICMGIILLPFVLFSHYGLSLWINTEFANNAAAITSTLAIGIFFFAISAIPTALINASGRSDIIAKCYLIELPFYALLLWWLLHICGLQGAAFAWAVRALLNAVLLYGYSKLVLF
jgi:O-antigen/teichoic acid export membrane protein